MSYWKVPTSPDEDQPWWLLVHPGHFVVATILVVGAILYGWQYFQDGGAVVPANELPLIQAEPGPVRIRSEEYIQPLVGKQEKLLFQNLDPTGELEKVVKLAPGAETPMDLQEVLNLPGTMSWDLTNEGFEEAWADAQEGKAQDAGEAIDPYGGKEGIDVSKLGKPSAKKTAQKASVAAKKYWVQIGVASSKKKANAMWKTLKSKYPAILGRHHPKIVRVGKKYHIHLGYFKDPKTADKLAQALQAKGTTAVVGRG